MIQIRDYQQRAVDFSRLNFRVNKITSLVAPCAGGKTIVSGEICRLARVKQQQTQDKSKYKILIIVPYQSLLDQFAESLIKFKFVGTKKMMEAYQKKNPDDVWANTIIDQGKRTSYPDAEIAFYAGSKGQDKNLYSAQIIIAMAQTIEARGVPNIPFSVIIFDESHLSYFRRELHEKLNQYKYFDKAKELLLTATPWRGDGAQYPNDVEHYQVITTHELIKTGYNSPYRYFPLAVMERSQAIKNHDLSEDEELAQLEKAAPPTKAWDELNREKIFNQKTIFFFGRKAIAKKYMEFFSEQMKLHGIDKELILVSDSTPPNKRTEAYEKFRKGECLLFTVTCLAIGFDEASVENIVLLRTFTNSGFALFIQILGRGLRISPATGKKECRFFDLCSNPLFPLPDEIMDWNSEDLPQQPDGKECPNCETVNGRAMKNCYMCGCDLPRTKEKPPQQVLSELEIKLQALLAEAKASENKPGNEIEKQIAEEFGVTDCRKFIERISLAGQNPEMTYRILLRLSVLVQKNKPGYAFFRVKQLFPDLDKVETDWSLHAIYGANPTYSNYLHYHYCLRKNYSGLDQYGNDQNAKIFNFLRREFGFYFGQFHKQYLQDQKTLSNSVSLLSASLS